MPAVVTSSERRSVAPLQSASPRLKRGIVALAGLVTVAGLVGTALTPWLLVVAPLGLIALNPGTQNVILVAPMVDPVALVALGATRRLVSLVATYWLGGLFGPAMVSWVQKRYPRTGAFIRLYTSVFERFGALFLIVAPLHSLAGIAGATGYRTLPFVLAVTLGQLIQLVVMTALGEAIAVWTAQVVAFLGQHVLTATLVFGTLAMAQLLVQRWRTGSWVATVPKPPPSPGPSAPPDEEQDRAETARERLDP